MVKSELSSNELIQQKHIVMFAYDGSGVLDVTGPLDVFSTANAIYGQALYKISIAAQCKEQHIQTSSAIRLVSDLAWTDPLDAHTVFIAGGPSAEEAPDELIDAVSSVHGKVSRLCSVCTGSFILAKAGLLHGKRATTHWARAEKLSQHYPPIEVMADAIHTKDGDIYTAAGVTAGIDLALALVEEDFGRKLMLDVARMLVVFGKRPGGQSQFSSHLISELCESRLSAAIDWIRQNYKNEIDTATLADRVSMSARNFVRVFKQELGITPTKFLEKIRLEVAVRLLEESTKSIARISSECGFSSDDHFRQAFARTFKVTPQQYQSRFK
ncbi:MAG: GlxA family transcriptional regulator [Methylophilus sp.]|uniref:GlxA family transcriptional regulator n=1 Tax=Methylophilus sp. TaxID=29541 RepID=UPI003FA14DE7